ncbi:hypothetical protein AB0N09_28160 [Streptomyces erythrochromogenes]|uniref:hypothetical protein n=1 Tax=Streptomyces erythrochromogenes TaxID=285574 RepID=UPI0034237BF3
MPYGHTITVGLLVVDRSDIGSYQAGHEPLWLVEAIEQEEDYRPGARPRTCARLRNAEVHGVDTTATNSGWTRLRPLTHIVEAAGDADRANPHALRMDVALHAFLRARRFQWCTSDDYATVRDLAVAAPYDGQGRAAFLLGARPVTPHGLAYEMGALSVCLSNLDLALQEGRTEATDLQEAGTSQQALRETRQQLHGVLNALGA